MLVEAFAPTIGFSSFSSLPDGCGFSGSRQIQGSFKVWEKTGSIAETARATAEDIVTLEEEFLNLRTIIPFSYKVRSDGKWINGGRTLEELNNPELTDGERIKRVMAVQDAMAQNPDLQQAVVVSEDIGAGRNYLYLYTKVNDQVNALAIEYQGNQDEFRNLIKTLSPKKNNLPFSFEQPLFFEAENELTISDVVKAVWGSFSPTRKEAAKPYLDRLTHDASNFPEIIQEYEKRVKSLTQRFQKEMLSCGNIVSGLATAVHGLSKMVEAKIEENREKYEVRLGLRPRLEEEKVSFRIRKKVEESFRPSFERFSFPQGEKRPDLVVQRGESEKRKAAKKPEEKSLSWVRKDSFSTREIQEIIKPAVPAMIAFFDSVAKEQALEGKLGREARRDSFPEETIQDKKRVDGEAEETKEWQNVTEFLLKAREEDQEEKEKIEIFSLFLISFLADFPIPAEEIHTEDFKDKRATRSNFFPEKARRKGITQESLKSNFFSADFFQWKSKQNREGLKLKEKPLFPVGEESLEGEENYQFAFFFKNQERREKFKKAIQIILESLVPPDESKNKEEEILEREEGKKLQAITEILLPFAYEVAGREKDLPLFLLLESYKSSAGKPKIREFILVLIYDRLKEEEKVIPFPPFFLEEEILEEKRDFLRRKLIQIFQLPEKIDEGQKRLPFFPAFALIALAHQRERLLSLSPISSFWEWFEFIFSVLPKNFRSQILLFVLSLYLSKKEDKKNESIEKLKDLRTNLFGTNFFKKKKKKISSSATLFFHQVIFQYRGTCHKVGKMTQ